MAGGELLMRWNYSPFHYGEETIKALAEGYMEELRKLVEHCVERGQKGCTEHTPSDYGLTAEVSYKELDDFLKEEAGGKRRREEVESVYRLSALQEGLLFHGLYDEKEGSYMEQILFEIKELDAEACKESWNELMKRHSVLRSGFYHDTFRVPVQCVYREVRMPVEELDLRGMEKAEQDRMVEEYREKDRQKCFDFKEAPLMRVGLLRLEDQGYRMLWTHHHLVFDGWSLPVVMGEFLEIYESLVSGQEVETKEEDRYEEYIHYIEGRDKEREEGFWREYMRGQTEGSLLPFVGGTLETE